MFLRTILEKAGSIVGQSPGGYVLLVNTHEEPSRLTDSQHFRPSSEPPELSPLCRLLDEHAAALVLYARQLCSDPEDAVQRAFIKLSDADRWPTELKAWLYRVVRNEAIAQWRSEQSRRKREQVVAQSRPSWFDPNPADRIDASAAVDALAALEPRQREIVVARIWGGLSFREIAELVGNSSSSVHREYTQAIRLLQHELSEPCPKTTPSPNRSTNR